MVFDNVSDRNFSWRLSTIVDRYVLSTRQVIY